MQLSRVPALAPAQREAAHSLSWARRLSRFPEPYQRRVAALASEHARLRDLALSFPALLFALAVPRADLDTALALRAAIAGERLKTIAAFAGIPMWLRALPPEAFAARIPLLPDGPAFAKQIVNHLPRKPNGMPEWLAAVGEACLLADEPHVLWVAREFATGAKQRERGKGRRRRRRSPPYAYTSLRRLCLWAWYSTHVPDAVAADVRWTEAIQLGGAEMAAARWLDEFDMRLTMGDEPVGDMWFEPATVDGFEFVPLRSAADLIEEANAMRNCVSGYARSVADNRSRLWSVRRAGVREATLELSQAFGDPLPTIYQLGGCENKTVERDLSLAARHWMEQHEHVLRQGVWSETSALPHAKVWRAHWRPYWLARRRIPEWLPLTPMQSPWDI